MFWATAPLTGGLPRLFCALNQPPETPTCIRCRPSQVYRGRAVKRPRARSSPSPTHSPVAAAWSARPSDEDQVKRWSKRLLPSHRPVMKLMLFSIASEYDDRSMKVIARLEAL